MSEPKSDYIHGTSADEQNRLDLMNSLINDTALGLLRLRPGETVLEVGAGLCQLARAMARQTRVAVVCIEGSPDQIREALRLASDAGESHLLDLRQGDVLAMPLEASEWGSFDVVHARFLLEHVPDPQSVVAEMVKAARSGGRIVLEDDDHSLMRLWPEPAGFDEVWDALVRSFERNSTDPMVGRKLVDMLHRAGADTTKATWSFYGGCYGQPAYAEYLENLARVIGSARQVIVEREGVPAETFDRVLREIVAMAGQPGSALWYGICWAEGVKR